MRFSLPHHHGEARACQPIIPDPVGLTPLRAYLATIPDPRAPRGHRHPLIAILAMATAAVLAGARSMTAIAEWAADTLQSVRAALGACRESPDHYSVYSVPAETTIRWALGRLNPQALAMAIGAWLGDRDRPQQRRQAIAVDAKTLRGAKRDGRQVHLLAAMDHSTRTVLAQRQVDGAPGEVPAFQPLLNGLDLAGAVITADALHTHADAAEFLVTGKQAHYLFVVKANQPTLLERCAALAWHNVPVAAAPATAATAASRSAPSRPSRSATSASRTPPRSCRSPARSATSPPASGTPWSSTPPPACRSSRPAPPTSSAGTGASRTACTGSAVSPSVRNASQLRTGTAPQVMASLRNLAIGVLSRAGPVNLAAALRRHARHPTRPLATLGISLG